MKDTLLIRRYQPVDQPAVWQLHDLALHSANAHAGDGPWDQDLHQIEDVYLQNGGEFLVGFCDGRLVAMGALKRTTAELAEVKRMRVDPAVQRRGFGQAILSALELRAVQLGYKSLRLDTTVQQKAAQGLYEKNGFVEVGRAWKGSFQCIVYEKEFKRKR